MKHQEITDKVIGVFYDVYNELWHGFLESVYQRSMLIAFDERGIEVKQQVEIPVWFHGRQAGIFYTDLLVADSVIVELKAVRTLDTSHEAQLLNYLRATNRSRASLEFRCQARNTTPYLRQSAKANPF